MPIIRYAPETHMRGNGGRAHVGATAGGQSPQRLRRKTGIGAISYQMATAA